MKKRNLILQAAIVGLFVTSLSGCGAMNTYTAAALSTGSTDYLGAKENIQKIDDLKLRAWVDNACAVNVGALQRAASTTGNNNVTNAVFTACPVPNVGVTSILPTGSMTVQTTNITPPAK